MKAIHGGKAKNDRIDALKIATLLRGGMLPQAYAYPAGMRATRDASSSCERASPSSNGSPWIGLERDCAVRMRHRPQGGIGHESRDPAARST